MLELIKATANKVWPSSSLFLLRGETRKLGKERFSLGGGRGSKIEMGVACLLCINWEISKSTPAISTHLKQL
jgi:hypothetical protein